MLKNKAKQANKAANTVQATEWPTLILIGLNYTLFIVLTMAYEPSFWWLILPFAAMQQALFGSLQHEVLHGHPTSRQWLNEAIIFPALNLWIPYPIYKESHLIHHNNQHLTNPARDPESFYIAPEQWEKLAKWQQAYYRLYHTFAGRILWGPIHIVGTLFYQEGRKLLKGDSKTWRVWGLHTLACIPVLYWIVVVCKIALWQYLLVFIYPGIALTLIRSYLEHRAVADPQQRSAIVETGPLLSLLFLNNNLHAVHHAYPRMAWYKIPAVWRAEKQKILQGNGGYYFAGYWDVLRQYFGRAKENPCFRLS